MSRVRKLTPEVKKQLKKLLKSDLSIDEISDELQVHSHTVRRWSLKYFRDIYKNRTTSHERKMIAYIKKHSDTQSSYEMANFFQVPTSKILRLIEKYDISYRKKR